MPLELSAISVDCADPHRLATFWSQALGHPIHPDDRPGDPEALIRLPQGPPLLFLRVPEPKTVKNRLHLDLSAAPGHTREQETDRLVGLGATLIDDRREPDGSGWTVLTDPEGNEFCVVRGDHER
ncbi:VOC family protein [Nocardiopsis sp. EMB25]|uniref:VOC family protein n=1 Tax=Nocardiopsis TaxID=2013 RepID=UPI00034DC2A7|nr:MULTISPECIES: VOC family protein [Nocardiopsis]MCY9783838.1 VOC family protein [Nocardiopsis sp. EMB25]